MKVLISKINNEVVGINIPTTPLSYEINVPDSIIITKNIIVLDGLKHKTNENGELLYMKPTEDSYLEVSYQTEPILWETIEIPNIELVPETIENDNGELVETGNMIEVQNGIKEVDVPVEYSTYEPVMVDNEVVKMISFTSDPTSFTIDDIIEAKCNYILKNNDYSYIISDWFINSDKLDLTDIQANTGVRMLQLLPNGYAKTIEIELATAWSMFEIFGLDIEEGIDVYINDVKFVDNQVILEEDVDKVVIKFVNTTDKFKNVNSYIIGY